MPAPPAPGRARSLGVPGRKPVKPVKPRKGFRRRRGEHAPTEELRARVRALSGYGVPHRYIAVDLGVPDETLHRHYAGDLARGAAVAFSRVGQTAFRFAAGAPAEYDANGRLLRAEIEANVAMTRFFLATRMGWWASANRPGEGEDPGGFSLDGLDLRRLSDAEYDTFKRLLRKATVAPTSDVAVPA